MDKNVVSVLRSGGVAVIPTDTLYGLVARAEDSAAVAKVIALKRRSAGKPLITLIADEVDLERLGVNLSPAERLKLAEYWPGPVSLILPATDGGRAFRLPANEDLRALLRVVGPLVAPSANLEGKPPARNVTEAKRYFGSGVDFYLDGGFLAGRASKLIDLTGSTPRIIRA